MSRISCVCVFVMLTMATKASDEPWVSVVDPPSVKFDWPSDLKLNAPVPKLFFDPGFAVASFGGPFASVGSTRNDREQRWLIDLRSGKVLSRMSGPHELHDPSALSHDGTFFAAKTERRQGNIRVFQTSDSSIVKDLKTDVEAEQLTFAGEHLLAVQGGHFQVFNFKKGKSLVSRKYDIGGWGNGRTTITPGGKYLIARNQSSGFEIIDIVQDKRVNESLESPMDGDQRTNLDGLAVSPDGKRLAVSAEQWGNHILAIYDLASGKLLSKNRITKPQHVFYPQRLLWSADSKAIYHNGEAILEPETGKAIFVPPSAGSIGLRYAVAANKVLQLDGSNRDDRRLKIVGITDQELTAAKDAVKAGGTAADGLLPPITPSDTTTAKMITPPPFGVAWRGQPDPAIPIQFDGQITSPFKLDNPRLMMVNGGTQPCAIFEFNTKNNDVNLPRPFKRVDLRSGALLSEFDLPPGLWIADIAPDSSIIATTDASSHTRVDLFPLQGTGSGKAYGFRPYERDASSKKVKLARLLTATRLLTVSETGRIAMWSLPDLKAIYVHDSPGFSAQTLSPNRKYLAGYHNGAVRVIDAFTGECVGDLLTSFVPQSTPTNVILFRDDGNELCATFNERRAGMMLSRWNLKTGELFEEEFIPGLTTMVPKPGYLSGDFLMLDWNWVYDLRHRAYVWHLTPLGGILPWYRCDDRLWYAVKSGANNTAIVARKFPDDDAIALINEVIEGPGAFLRDGTRIKLHVSANGAMGNEYLGRIRDGVSKSWRDRQIKIVQGEAADVDIDFIVSERSTGERLQFRGMGMPFGGPFGGGGDSVPVIELTAQATLRSGGQNVWSQPAHRVQTQAPFIVSMPRGENDITRHLHKQTWEQIVAYASGSTIPKFVSDTSRGIQVLPQRSILRENGLDQGR